MKTNLAGMRALAPFCLLLSYLVLNGCADLKGNLLGTAPAPEESGYVVVEGRVSSLIDEVTLPSSFTYTAASGTKTDIVTVHATSDGTYELLSHALQPTACKVTLALTPAEVSTLNLYFRNELICRYIPARNEPPVLCASFVAEGHQYRIRSEGENIRIGGCTVEGYKYLCDSKASFGASEYLRTVVLPSKTAAECVPL